MEQLQELLVDGLRDIYDAEKQLVKALPKLTKALTNNELKESFTMHLEQTRNQVTRVEKCLELLGEKARSKPCKAMKGLVEEANEHLQEHEKGEVLDQIIIASAQKVEHYEIAAYGTAKAYAKSLGNREALDLIVETLREEEGMDKTLSGQAIRLQKDMGRAGNGKAAAKKAPARTASSGNGASSGKTSSGKASSGSRVLTDHDEIRKWAEDRGAHPACVRGTGKRGDLGILRLDFPGYTGAGKLEEIEWDEFFTKFDKQGLSLLVQDKTSGGKKSNFNKLVSRETAGEVSKGKSRRAGR
ncbi:MAG TPA: ferritin-like domain-containing protein [Bryobacteraceae bacterium]|nr:ferritin-like domain-containing protein [Bryobacteraceae bacterium]